MATVMAGLLAVPAHSQQSSTEQPDNWLFRENHS
jgi:hypothetical protein